MTNNDAAVPTVEEECKDAVALVFEVLRRRIIDAAGKGDMGAVKAASQVYKEFEEVWYEYGLAVAGQGCRMVWDEQVKELVPAAKGFR